LPKEQETLVCRGLSYYQSTIEILTRDFDIINQNEKRRKNIKKQLNLGEEHIQVVDRAEHAGLVEIWP
jgi:hypothetical protein